MQIQLNKKVLNLSLNQQTQLNLQQNSIINKSSMFPEIRKSRVYSNGPGPGKYSRSSSIGHLNHDVTLMRNPAYSIGKAVRMFDLNTNPFLICSTKTSNDRSNYKLPGPATYEYEKHSNPFKSSVPSFTIGKAPRFPNYYVY